MSRIGKLVIGEAFIADMGTAIHDLFSELAFVPYRVEHDFVSSSFEMLGESPLFEEVPEGLDAPLYFITAKKWHSDDEKLSRQWSFEVRKESDTEEKCNVIDYGGKNED